MPELPEVEAARRAIEEHCLGKKIVRVIVADDPKVIDGVAPRDFEASLTHKTIVAALRKGKNLWLRLDSPPFPSFQFGMAGAIYIKGVAVTKYKRSAVDSTDEWPSKYSKVFVHLDDGLEFSFTDKRRFAKVRLLNNPESVVPISELGPDALLEPMKEDEFAETLRRKKIAIKSLLLDQSFIAGIGNWIADEVLYQAKIHPLQIAASLTSESCVCLLRCIKEVIEKALEVGADSNQFPKNWVFHSREKKPGKAFVDGKEVEFITAGGRTTAYVPELQKLSGTQSGKAGPTKQRKRKSSRKADDDEEESGGEEDVNEEVGGEEERNTENIKSKKDDEITTDGSKKKPSAKSSTKASPDEVDGAGETKKKTKRIKKETKVEVSKKRLRVNQTSAQKKKRK